MQANMKTVSISLPETLFGYVRTRAKEQGNVSDYIRTLIRDDQKREKEARLQDLLLEGVRSKSAVLTPEHWEQLKAEILERIKN